MKKIIEDLFKLDRYLLGEGYDKALDYINKIIPLKVLSFTSGTKLETWEVPQEWIIRDAWVKFQGKKIIDWKKDKLAVAINSIPVHKTIKLEELKKHLNISNERPNATPYSYEFYHDDWGFNLPQNKYKVVKANEKGEICDEKGLCFPELKALDPEVGKVMIEGWTPEYNILFEEGDYEVFIDSEFKAGTMKVGVHTIQGSEVTAVPKEREILLFAHLDHPWQANDNLSSVACLVDIAKKIQEKHFTHTVKLIFCPETIGSIAYALTQDISKVDFMIALECVGTDGDLLWQKAYEGDDPVPRITRVTHLAVQNIGETYQKANFRIMIGSDEYVFNDPKIGIPGIMLSRWSEKKFPEYHTSDDKPEILKMEKIEKVQELILKIIEIYEKDYIPVRNFKAPLFRSKYGIQTPYKDLNLSHDYLIYAIDGKKSLAELCGEFALNFDFTYDFLNKVEKDGGISRINFS